ncbi:MAG: hypothetical protein PHW04_08950 [Candidatus Wallbacteria bacterium]|nr:hypothetical protein [Candidatus Wallbacteria bacterium]
MKTIVFFTRKYFYAREITDFLNFYNFQVLTYWQEAELFKALEEQEPWLLIVDYVIGEENWVRFFEKLWQHKQKRQLKIMAFWERGDKKLEPRLIDFYMEKPVVLSELKNSLDRIQFSSEVNHKADLEIEKSSSQDENPGVIHEHPFETGMDRIPTPDRMMMARKTENHAAPLRIDLLPKQQAKAVSAEQPEKRLRVKKIEEDLDSLRAEVEEIARALSGIETRICNLQAENHYLKGYVYYLKGNKKSAGRECELALEIEPDLEKARQLMGHIQGR